MNALGRVIRYYDNVDTDVIIPARYLCISDPAELAKHCMEDIDKDFLHKIKSAKIIVAGSNFGCGSSREHAPIAIKACGISCIIAESFARIFYRNAINIGLPILECAKASVRIEDNDEINANFSTGKIINLTKSEEYLANAFPDFMQAIIKAGGLMNTLKL